MTNNLITQQKAVEIVRGLNIREVVETLFDMVPRGLQGYYAGAFLNLETGEVEYHTMNNALSFRDNIFVCVYSINSEFETEVESDDIAGEDPIPQEGVQAFPDYEDRLLECLVYFATEGKDALHEAEERVLNYYEVQE